jgi:alkylation response protein AidB-like acyl-CoA dehydrogenase
MAEVGKVCGASAFMMWCQAVCGLYMQTSDNPALTGERLQGHMRGLGLGGTGLSNPMKSFAQIENLLLKATPIEGGGYRVNGTLPWISNLAGDHYFGAIAAVMDGEHSAGREVMFILKCDAPGVTLKECPKFSGMEGTGTYAVQCKDLVITPADIVADPGTPLHPQNPRSICDVAVWHCGRHCAGRHRQHLGLWNHNWATLTNTLTTGPRTCRPSWTIWWVAS